MHTFFHGLCTHGRGNRRAIGRFSGFVGIGVTTTYGLKSAEERGGLFYDPGMDVYEGHGRWRTPAAWRSVGKRL